MQATTKVDELARELRLCGIKRDLPSGKRIHAGICRSELANSTYLANLAIEMYGKCGSVEEAMASFERIPRKNVYSWNILMVAFASNGHLPQAREIFDRIPCRNHVSYTAMVAAYAQCGQTQHAKAIFDSMPAKTITSWNAMITGYANARNLAQARSIFDSMPRRDTISWNTILAAYSQTGDFAQAKLLFDRAPQRDLVSWTTMLTAYARAGKMGDAQALFDCMPDVNLVGWTCLIAGYADTGQEIEAILAFKRMDLSGCEPDQMAFVTVIDACAKVGAEEEGTALHGDVAHRGLATDVVVATALVTLYGRCSRLDRALAVFDAMLDRSVVSWSALISAFAQNGRGRDAIRLFQLMELEGLQPNEITLVSVFDACSSVPDLALGKLLHSELDLLLQRNEVLATAVINMYGKSGSLALASEVFFSSQVARNDVVSWTAMITAYARNGFPDRAQDLLREMQLQGVKPNQITLVSLLSICSHSGKLADGFATFRLLDDYHLSPTLEHYVCMVDLLGRSGRLRDAEDLIANMPFEPHTVAWMTLLSSSRDRHKFRDKTASEIVKLSRDDAAPYVLLSNAR